MEVWLVIIIVVSVVTTGRVLSEWIRSKEGNTDYDEKFNRLNDRLAQIEDRLGNMETLVVEREKYEKFERAL
jgi:Skp family chaperone for outer membrane proteins